MIYVGIFCVSWKRPSYKNGVIQSVDCIAFTYRLSFYYQRIKQGYNIAFFSISKYIRGSFKKYVENVAVRRRKFLKNQIWHMVKSYILSTIDISINLVE